MDGFQGIRRKMNQNNGGGVAEKGYILGERAGRYV